MRVMPWREQWLRSCIGWAKIDISVDDFVLFIKFTLHLLNLLLHRFDLRKFLLELRLYLKVLLFHFKIRVLKIILLDLECLACLLHRLNEFIWTLWQQRQHFFLQFLLVRFISQQCEFEIILNRLVIPHRILQLRDPEWDLIYFIFMRPLQ